MQRRPVAPHPRRDELIALVQQDPGVTEGTLWKRTGWAKNIVHHHVAQLLRARRLRLQRDGRYRRLYPSPVTP